MWEIWANLLLPKAFKSCPKYKKSQTLATLLVKNDKRNENNPKRDRGGVV